MEADADRKIAQMLKASTLPEGFRPTKPNPADEDMRSARRLHRHLGDDAAFAEKKKKKSATHTDE